MEGAGAGYTLALFDMDKVSTFLSQFDAFIRMATAAINAHDYGMLMAMLRGQAVTIPAEEDFMIYDLGLFLEGLTADSNIFWNTCDDRIVSAGENARQYLEDSIVYFQADFVRQDMTGSTIFYSTSGANLNSFYAYNDDMKSSNYISLLQAMNATLGAVELGNAEWTTDSCTATAPDNFTFAIHGNEVAYSEEYGVYKLTTEVTATVMGASSSLRMRVGFSNFSMSFGLADLATKIVDEDFDSAQLVTYWDGRVALFRNAIANTSELYSKLGLSNDEFYASGEISFVSVDDTTSVPLGYVVKYPVYVYDDVDSVPEDIHSDAVDWNVTNYGYLQFEVLFKRDADNSEYIDIDNVLLYEVDVMEGVVAEVSHDSMRIITPLAMYGVDGWNYTNVTDSDDNDDDESDRRRFADLANNMMTTGMFTTDMMTTDMDLMTSDLMTTDMMTTDMDMLSTETFPTMMMSTEEWPTYSTTSSPAAGGGPTMQVTGILVWPQFTVEHKVAMTNESGVLVFELEAEDVFGNGASTMFDVSNATAWNVTVGTTEPPMSTTEMPMSTTEAPVETTEEMGSTMETEETTEDGGDGGKTVEKLEHGLDSVPGFVWLIIIGCLVVMGIILFAMFWRKKGEYEDLYASAQGGQVGSSKYVQMDDKGDDLL